MIGHEIAGIAMAIVTGAILISLFSKNSNTSGVISASTTGFSNLLQAMTGSGGGQQAA